MPTNAYGNYKSTISFLEKIIMSLKETLRNKFQIKEIWSLSWPMALIMFYEFLIGLTDVYIAGKFGKEIQAAYGLAFQLYFAFIIIGMALGVGIVSVSSRLFTSGKTDKLNIAVNSSLALAIVSGMFFSLIGVLFSGDLINTLHIPQELKAYAIPFLTIYSLGFLFDYILLSTNGILRSCAMIKKSLWVMSVVCVMNVALNFALALGTPLGYKGIAAATVISLFAGSILSIFYVRKLVTGFKFSLGIVKEILNISWPSGLLQVFWQIGAVVLFLILSMLPTHNVEIIAALTNGLKIESFIFLPAFAFNMASAVLVGNLLGKNDKENAFRGGVATAIIGVAIVTVLTIIIIFNARHIAGFLSNNDTVVNESIRYIYIALLFEPIMAWGVILGGGLGGAGDTRSVMIVTALGIWCVRIPLSYIFGVYFGFGAIAIWWSMNFSILTQAIFLSKRYFGRRWIAQAGNRIAD